MEASCPVCQQAIPEGAEHCPKCGFPTTLRDRLAGPLTLTETPEGEKPEGASVRSAGADEVSGPEAELNAALATTLQERMELLWTFDRDAPDATGAL